MTTQWTPQRSEHQPPQVRPWTLPSRHSTAFYVTIIAVLAAGIISFVMVLPTLTEAEGSRAAATAGLLALVPVFLVTALVVWLDSWEPEPKWLMLAMFVWGGGIAILGTLIINTAWVESFYESTGNANQAQIFGVVIAAPVVEETLKGLGVIVAFIFFRRYFNGPIDGICYGAMSGLGFAFTENILYFTRFWSQLSDTYVARAFVSPLLHPVSTAMMGLMLGFAVYKRNALISIFYFLLGYIAGVFIHAMHNGAAVAGQFGSLVLWFQVPSYIAALVIALWLRHDELQILKARLAEYQQAGWFAPFEVDMLTSKAGRRQARAWASARGQKKAMKTFQDEASHLALNRHRAAVGAVSVPKARTLEAQSLSRITIARHVYGQ